MSYIKTRESKNSPDMARRNLLKFVIGAFAMLVALIMTCALAPALFDFAYADDDPPDFTTDNFTGIGGADVMFLPGLTLDNADRITLSDNMSIEENTYPPGSANMRSSALWVHGEINNYGEVVAVPESSGDGDEYPPWDGPCLTPAIEAPITGPSGAEIFYDPDFLSEQEDYEYEKDVRDIIDAAKVNGVTEINGVPIEDCESVPRDDGAWTIAGYVIVACDKPLGSIFPTSMGYAIALEPWSAVHSAWATARYSTNRTDLIAVAVSWGDGSGIEIDDFNAEFEGKYAVGNPEDPSTGGDDDEPEDPEEPDEPLIDHYEYNYGVNQIDGSARLLFYEKAKLRDGTLADVEITIDDIECAVLERSEHVAAPEEGEESDTGYGMILASGAGFEAQAWGVATEPLESPASVDSGKLLTETPAGWSYRISVRILQHEEEDLDAPVPEDRLPVSVDGGVLFAAKDIDSPAATHDYESGEWNPDENIFANTTKLEQAFQSRWAESIELDSGFDGDIFHVASHELSQDDIDKNIVFNQGMETVDVGFHRGDRVRGSAFQMEARGTATPEGDPDTYWSGFMTIGSPAGFSFYYAASNTSTTLFLSSEAQVNATSGEHGTIEPADITTYVLGCPAQYSYQPHPGYKVESLVVNDEPADFTVAGGTYTFEQLYSNPLLYKVEDQEELESRAEVNTIEVTYQPISYKVVFDANADDAEGSMDDQERTYGVSAALPANAFVRSGFGFTGWNTERLGGGQAFEDEEVTFDLTTTDDDEVHLFAQWGKLERQVTLQKADADDGTPLQGANITLSGTSDGGEDISSTATSNENGELDFGEIPYGTYTLVENQPPNGYMPPNGTWEVAVSETGVAFTEGSENPFDGTTLTLFNTHSKPALTITKEASKEEANIGDEIGYTIKVENTGNCVLSHVTVIDEKLDIGVPEALELAETLDVGVLETVSGTYTVTEDDAIVGEVVNTASATAAEFGEEEPQSASATTTIVSSPKIGLSKTPRTATVSPADVGTEVTWDFEVTNLGDVTLQGIQISDPKANDIVELENNEPLAPGNTVRATATTLVTVDELNAGVVVNTATASATSVAGGTTVVSEEASASATLQREAKLSIEKTVDKSSASLGETLQYTITVKNEGNAPLTNIAVTDSLVGMDNTKIADSLAVGETTQITKNYGPLTETHAQAQVVTNTASATADAPPGLAPPSTEPVSVTTNVVAETGLELVTHEAALNTTGNPHVDDVVTWNVTVRNTGGITLEQISLEDPVLQNRGIEIPVLATSLPPGAECTAGVDMPLTQEDIDAGVVTNSARVLAISSVDGAQVATSSVSASINIPRSPAFTVVNESTTTSVGIGGSIDYTITVKNEGNCTLSDIRLSDAKAGISNRQIAETLAPGASIYFTCTYSPVTQADACAKEVVNVASVTAHPPSGLSGLPSQSASVSTPVTAVSGLTIVKSAEPTAISQPTTGSTITWKFLVKNTGDVSLSEVAVIDPYLAGKNKTATFNGNTTTTLAPGASAEATASTTVTANDINDGQIVNEAYAQGREPVDNTMISSPSSIITVGLGRSANLSVIKHTVSPQTASIGTTLTYTITVKNTGNVTVAPVTISDPLLGLSSHQVAERLAPGAEVEFQTTYGPLTEQDARAGTLTSVVTATGDPPTGMYPPVATSAPLSVPVSAESSVSIVKSGELKATGNPKVGDVVTWKFVVTNTGDATLQNPYLDDSYLAQRLGNVGLPSLPQQLARGQACEVDVDMILTQEDIDAGRVMNTALVRATSSIDNSAVVSAPSSAEVTLPRQAAFTIDKVVVKQDPSKDFYVNDPIDYMITVTNTGNVTLRNVRVSDGKLNIDQQLTASLAPDTSEVLRCTYPSVTEADAINKFVVNTASASVTTPSGVPALSSKSTTVRTPVFARPALEIVMTSTPSRMTNPSENDKVSWGFTVTNKGDITISDIRVVDDYLAVPVKFGNSTTITLAPGQSANTNAVSSISQQEIDSGQILNEAIVKGTEPVNGATIQSRPGYAVLKLSRNPELSLTKTVDKTTASVGDHLTYTITVENTGNVTLAPVTVTDPILGMSEPYQVSASLAPGASQSIIREYGSALTAEDARAGLFVNTATAHGTPPIGVMAPPDPTAKATTTVLATAGLKVEKSYQLSSSGIPQAGDVLTWKVTASNTGDAELRNVQVDDQYLTTRGISLPPVKTSLALDESTFTSAAMPLTQADIDNGSVSNTVDARGVSVNDGSIVEAVPATSTAQLTRQPQLSVTCVPDKTDALLGEPINYTIKVKNTGNVSLTSVRFDSVLLSKENYPLADTLLPGEEASVDLRYNAIQEHDATTGKVTNTVVAKAQGPAGAGNPPIQQANGITNVSVSSELFLAETASPAQISNAKVGDVIEWSLTLTNRGTTNLSVFRVSAPLLAEHGVQFSGFSPEVLTPGSSATAKCQMPITQADLDAGFVQNNVQVSGKSIIQDATITSNMATARVELQRTPKISLTNNANKQGAKAGDTITYTIVATNNGPVTLAPVTLDAPLLGVSARTISSSLAPGDSATYTGSYTVTENDMTSLSQIDNLAVVTGKPAGDADAPVSASATSTVSLGENGKLSLTIRATDPATIAPVAAGDKLTWYFTVKNEGEVRLTNIAIEDLYLASRKIAIPIPGGTALNPGASKTFTVSAPILHSSILKGQIANTGVAHGKTPRNAGVDSTPYAMTVDLTRGTGDFTVTSDGRLKPKVLYYSGVYQNYLYTGNYICPKPTIKIKVNNKKQTLTRFTDYKLIYSNNRKVGTAKITVKLIGRYSGDYSIKYNIKRKK